MCFDIKSETYQLNDMEIDSDIIFYLSWHINFSSYLADLLGLTDIADGAIRAKLKWCDHTWTFVKKSCVWLQYIFVHALPEFLFMNA